jgi:hypothetical protein
LVGIFEQNYNSSPIKQEKVLCFLSKKTENDLDMWKERFGITDADIRGEGERVNVVNNIEEVDISLIQELDFDKKS